MRRYIDNPWIFRVFREFHVDSAKRNSPELVSLDAQIRAQERSVTAAKRAFWVPVFGLRASFGRRLAEGGAGTLGDGSVSPLPPEFPVPDRNNWEVGVQATLPLFAGGERAARRSQAEVELGRLQTERAAVANRVEQRVRSTLHNTGASYTAIGLARQSADAARRNLELVQDSYGRGVVSIIDLLDAQNAAVTAEAAAANAINDFLLDLMDVERAVGRFGFFVTPAERQDYFDRLNRYVAEEEGAARARSRAVNRGSAMPTPHPSRPPMPPQRPAAPWAWLLVSALVGGLLGCSSDAPPAEPELRPVRFEVVSSVEAGRRRSFSGTCQPAVEPKLSFKVDGTIARRPVNMGDRVKRGALIAELDPSDFQLQLEEAAAALRRAEAESRNAQASFARIRGLYENGNASRTDFDGARAAAESGRAYVESIRKRLELARQQLSYTRLVAPVAGAVAEVSAEVNENVRAGQEVVRLAAEEGYEVVVTVPESLIGQIRAGPGRARDLRRPSRAHVRGHGDRGRASPPRRTGTAFPVKARLVEEDPGVRPGMAAELEFRFEAPGRAPASGSPPTRWPRTAQGRFVFVVEPSEAGRGTVRRREVEVGALTPAGIEVLEGLEEGDRLVTAGISQIEDGDAVKLAAEG